MLVSYPSSVRAHLHTIEALLFEDRVVEAFTIRNPSVREPRIIDESSIEHKHLPLPEEVTKPEAQLMLLDHLRGETIL